MDLSLLSRRRGDFLWGSFVHATADGFFDTVDPATGLLLDRVPYRVANIDVAVSDATAAAPAWANTPVPDRVAILRRLQGQLIARRNQLATLISREMGKPLWEAQLECAAATRAIDLLIEQGQVILEPCEDEQVFGRSRRRPVGTAAVLTPYPYPVYFPLTLLVPALLGGNPVLWKPSSKVPLVSQKLAECFDCARFPRGIFAMLQGPRDPIGAKLLAHPGIDMLIGAGDARLSRALRRSTAGSRRHVWAQSGGKGWSLVCGDADLDRAAYEVVTSAFLTAGQRCNATSRVVVERSVADELLARIVAITRGLRIGPPMEGDNFCGPLAGATARRQFRAVLKKLRGKDHDFLVDGGIKTLPSHLRRRGQCYVAPSIVRAPLELPQGVPLPEEVEGPLLFAVVVDDVMEAVDAYNDHPYGLSAAIFTSSPERFEELAQGLRAGTVNCNRGTIVASARYSNAGVKRSGQGAAGNAHLLYSCTYPQASLEGRGPFDPRHRVPGMKWPSEMETTDSWADETMPVVVAVPDL